MKQMKRNHRTTKTNAEREPTIWTNETMDMQNDQNQRRNNEKGKERRGKEGKGKERKETKLKNAKLGDAKDQIATTIPRPLHNYFPSSKALTTHL